MALVSVPGAANTALAYANAHPLVRRAQAVARGFTGGKFTFSQLVGFVTLVATVANFAVKQAQAQHFVVGPSEMAAVAFLLNCCRALSDFNSGLSGNDPNATSTDPDNAPPVAGGTPQ